VKIFRRCAAVFLIVASLVQALLSGPSRMFAAHPELDWLAPVVDVMRWLLMPVNIWLGLTLWRGTTRIVPPRSRGRATGSEEFREVKFQ
jgi:hypothetical protein